MSPAPAADSTTHTGASTPTDGGMPWSVEGVVSAGLSSREALHVALAAGELRSLRGLSGHVIPHADLEAYLSDRLARARAAHENAFRIWTRFTRIRRAERDVHQSPPVLED